MNARRYLLPLLLACALHAGAQVRPVSEDSGANSASVKADGEKYVGTVRGRAGIAIVDRDKVELAHGMVYVNGQSYGKVPEVCEVRYEITKNGKTLFVDGQVRRRPAAH